MKKPNDKSRQTIDSRRSFVLKTGAAVSATLAAATAGAAGLSNENNRALKEELRRKTGKLGRLEDTNAVRELHRAYARHLNNRAYEDIIDLFTDDGEMHYNGDVFKGRNGGLRRLFVEQFGGSEKAAVPVHDRVLYDQTMQQDDIEISPDGRTAIARFQCLVDASEPLTGVFSFIEMARLQGQAGRKWRENGVFEVNCVKADSNWKISKLAYRTAHQPGQVGTVHYRDAH